MDKFYYNFVMLGISEIGFIPWLALTMSLVFIILTFIYSIFLFIRWIFKKMKRDAKEKLVYEKMFKACEK